MGTITLTLTEKQKAELKYFSWVNWSEIARLELVKEKKNQQTYERIKKILTHSTLTEEDAQKLADDVSHSLVKRYKQLMESS